MDLNLRHLPAQSINSFRINCDIGEFIDVKDAAYGRSDGATCPSEHMSDQNCKASNSLEKVLEMYAGTVS